MSDIVIEPDDIRTRVARGARLLDEKDPGWAARVALDALAMSECDRCIVGQLYPDGYYEGLLRLFTREELQDDQEIDYGFESNVYDRSSRLDDYAELAEAWRAEVVARTGGAA